MISQGLNARMLAKAAAVSAVLILGIGGLCNSSTINYSVKNAGTVSLGIYDGKSRLVRTLQSGKKQEPGSYSIEWDGKDDAGVQVPSGPYTCKGLSASIGCQYLMGMGNSGTPTHITADGMGGWGGTHGNVRGAASTPDGKNLYVLWGFEEGTPALLKVNPQRDAATGRLKIWGAHNNWAWGFCQSVAADADYVYVGTNEGGNSPAGPGETKTLRSMIWRVKADTGEYARYSTDDGLIRVSEVPSKSMPIDTPAWVMYADPTKRQSVGFRTNLFAIAVDKTNLYCSLRQENKIAVFDKKTGKSVRQIAIKDPAGVALSPDGNLYAVSGRTLVMLSPEGKVLSTVIKSGLASPYGVTVDKSGLIYISDQATSMQVKIFSPSGKFIKSIGKTGGRSYGGEWAKMKSDLLYPTQPAVLADGTIYVGEDCAPKRVAIFKNRKFADEWIGTLASGCAKIDIADEQNPEYLYQTYWPFDMVRYKVDYKKKTSVLDAVWGYTMSINGQELGDVPARQNGSRPSLFGGIKENGAYQSSGSEGWVRHFDGKTYLFVGDWWISVYRIDGHNLTPCGTLTQVLAGEPLDIMSKNWSSRPAMDPAVGTHPCVWTDKNKDWEAQESEVDWSVPAGWKAVPGGRTPLRPYVDEKMNVYFEDWKVPFEGLDAKGNPMYSWKNAVKIPTHRAIGKITDTATGQYDHSTVVPIGLDQDGDVYPMGRQVGLRTDPTDGSYYVASDMEGKGKGIGWASSGIYARIGKIDAAGNWVWMAGSKATGFNKPGQFYKPSEFTGVLKGCLFTNDWNGQIRIHDKDSGLYVGSVLADGYRGVRADEYLINVEFTEGCVYINRVDGKVYALGGDSTGLRVFEITGLDGIERFSTPVANQ